MTGVTLSSPLTLVGPLRTSCQTPQIVGYTSPNGHYWSSLCYDRKIWSKKEFALVLHFVLDPEFLRRSFNYL